MSYMNRSNPTTWRWARGDGQKRSRGKQSTWSSHKLGFLSPSVSKRTKSSVQLLDNSSKDRNKDKIVIYNHVSTIRTTDCVDGVEVNHIPVTRAPQKTKLVVRAWNLDTIPKSADLATLSNAPVVILLPEWWTFGSSVLLTKSTCLELQASHRQLPKWTSRFSMSPSLFSLTLAHLSTSWMSWHARTCPPVQINPTPTAIYAYGTHTPLTVFGQFQTDIMYKEIATVASVFVVRSRPDARSGNLLSSDTAQKLG